MHAGHAIDKGQHSHPLGQPGCSAMAVLAYVRRHPLLVFVLLAYLLSWWPWVWYRLDPGNVDAPILPFGPFLAAAIVLAIIGGRDAILKWLGKIVHWRVGWGWYALVLLVPPALTFLALGLNLLFGAAASWSAIDVGWPQLLIRFVFIFLWIGLGEEPAWRGFALPRLQRGYGPLAGSLILGVLHGLWHLPVYFIPGSILEGPFDFTVFAANTCLIIAMTFIWTWLFNHAGQSILFAMFVHGVSNAASGLIPRLIVDTTGDPWFGFKVGAACALIIIVFTRGRLGYPSFTEKEDVH